MISIKKRVLTIALILIFVSMLALITMTCAASEETDADDSGICGDGVTYSYVDTSKTLSIQYTGTGTGAMTNYDITSNLSPWYKNDNIEVVIIENGVKSIGTYAFFLCKNLRSITIPDTLSSIGSVSLSGCESLESITIPSSVHYIGKEAFSGCSSIKSIDIPYGVTDIQERTFLNCDALEFVTIPEGVYLILDAAFNHCISLKSIILPDSLEGIGPGVFGNCHALESITIPYGVTVIGDDAFHGCHALESINLPNTLQIIGKEAFAGCPAKSITLPNSVTKIDDYAFAGSGLVTVNIPNSVTSIADGLFFFCSHLVSVNIPNSVTSIGKKAFESCTSLGSIALPDSVAFIDDDAFLECTGVTCIKFGNADLVIIGKNVFSVYGTYDFRNIFFKDSKTSTFKYEFIQDYWDKFKGKTFTGKYTEGMVLTESPSQTYTVNIEKDYGVELIRYSIGTSDYTDYFGPFQINSGQNLTVQAMMREGYTFVRWSSGSTENPCTISNVTNDMNLSAVTEKTPTETHYVYLGYDRGVEKVLYRVGTDAYIEYNGAFQIKTGQKLTIQAILKSGYSFVSWASGITDNPYVIDQVDSDVSLSAVSAADAKEFNVDVKAEPTYGGKVFGEGIYKPGSVVALSVTPADGWKFVKWSSQQVSINDGKFIMPSMDVSVDAIFEETSTTSGMDPLFIIAGALVICLAAGVVVFIIKR